MDNQFPVIQIETELSNASLFKLNDELGKSRVCARKAAGLALRFWLQQNQKIEEAISPFKAIEFFYAMPDIPPEMQKIAGHLLQKVDADYHFPEHINLIKAAEKIVKFVKSQSEV